MQRKSLIYVVILGLLTAFAGLSTIGAESEKHFRAKQYEISKVRFGELELTVPAEATTEEMTVANTALNLEGIQKPYGFIPIGKPYKFGPHGLKFKRGKGLGFRMKLTAEMIPKGYSMGAVRLFYINRKMNQLEQVPEQSIDWENGYLESQLEHFSEYIPGVVAGWDGQGLNPFQDYITNGEESVLLNGLSLAVNSPVYSLPGRGGLDLNLNRSYSYTGTQMDDPFAISPKWYWDLPHYTTGKLCMPGGASYTLTEPIYFNSNKTICTYDKGIVFKVDTSNPTCRVIYLANGLRIEAGANYQQVTDKNGNSIRYNFTNFNPISYGSPLYKLTSIVDSIGREFKFYYESQTILNNITFLCLTRVEQIIPGGSPKTILTRSH